MIKPPDHRAPLGLRLSSVEPAVRTIPSNDPVFARFVERAFAELPTVSAADLERRLRRLYPRALVRPCELALVHHDTWYIYREGRWVGTRQPVWWDGPGLARFVADADGFVGETNEAAEALLGNQGRPGERLVGCHLSELLVDATVAEVADLGAALGTKQDATATIRVRTLCGEQLAVEQHAVRRPDGGTEFVMRPVVDVSFLAEAAVPASDRAIELVCEPHADRLFASYADVVLRRLERPTVATLESGLRLLYPEAAVAGEGHVWRCRRDDAPPAPAGWWLEPGWPVVIVDRQSLIRAASRELEAFVGRPLVGTFWQELTPAGRVPDALAGVEVLFSIGGTDTVVVLETADGSTARVDAHVEIEGDLARAAMRLAAAR